MELKGAEILAEGRWNGIEFDAAALDGIVAAFDALGLAGRVPLKLGHSGLKENDAQPALGWVEKVYRQGKRLLADIVDIPQVIYAAIRSGAYKHVSVEILRNVRADTRTIPFVLDAVALLGATQPAVGILKDLQQLTLTRGTGLQCARRLVFKQIFNGGQESMSEEISELKAQLAEREQQLIGLTFENAVRDGKCLPRERVLFTKRYGNTATVADAQQWISTAQRPPPRCGATRSTSAAPEDSDEPADVRLAAAVQVVVDEHAEKFKERLGLHEATLVALKRNPQLANEYKNLYGEV